MSPTAGEERFPAAVYRDTVLAPLFEGGLGLHFLPGFLSWHGPVTARMRRIGAPMIWGGALLFALAFGLHFDSVLWAVFGFWSGGIAGHLAYAGLGRLLGWQNARENVTGLPIEEFLRGAPFAFAGLYDGTGAAILTTEANAVCAPVHDRMPVVLPGPEAEAAWLSEDVDVDVALELLAPLEDARVSVAPANPAVNKAGVEGPELLTPPLTQHSDTLF